MKLIENIRAGKEKTYLQNPMIKMFGLLLIMLVLPVCSLFSGRDITPQSTNQQSPLGINTTVIPTKNKLLFTQISSPSMLEKSPTQISMYSWKIQIVDNSGNVGRAHSMALDNTGLPHISYLDSDNGYLKYALLSSNNWKIETVDTNIGNLYGGGSTSIAIDNNGLPHIGYWDFANSALKYAQKIGTNWSIEKVDIGVGHYGGAVSLALDNEGNPHISYYDGLREDLKYAYWSGGNWNIQTVDSNGDVGATTSLAIDKSGNPHISYYDNTNTTLKYASWNSNAWDIKIVDSDEAGGSSSLVLGPDDYPHIAYSGHGALKYGDWSGGSWNIQSIDSSSGFTAGWLSQSLDTINNPNIIYEGQNAEVKYAKWTGSKWEIQTASISDGVDNIDLILDSTNIPLICFYDSSEKYLKYAVGEPK